MYPEDPKALCEHELNLTAAPGEVGKCCPHIHGGEVRSGGEQACQRLHCESAVERQQIQAGNFSPGCPDAANSTWLPTRSCAGLHRWHARSPMPLARSPCRHWVPPPRCSRVRATAPRGNTARGGLGMSPPLQPTLPSPATQLSGGTLELPARLAGVGDSHAAKGTGTTEP